jgi:hypothetical protein
MMFEKNLIGKNCVRFISLKVLLLFSHKSATIIVNDIKRNLANLEDVLGQCSIESRTRYDGDVSELKIQLERMMVNIFSVKIFFVN